MQPTLPHSAFARFAVLCEALAATTRKLEKCALIAEWLRILTPEDAGRGALYLAGSPFSETDQRRLNVGGALLTKAIAAVSGADSPAMQAAYLLHGDLGEAAFDLLQDRSPAVASLALEDIDNAFEQLSLASRPAPKLRLVVDLLARATPQEAKYLVKLVLGDMRTGVKQSLVEEGIATAYSVDPTQVRSASVLNGSLPEVVRMAAEDCLADARMKLFHALGFMLASPVDSVEEALGRFAQEIAAEEAGVPNTTLEQVKGTDAATSGEIVLRNAQLEDKYDGIRAQLHAGDPSQPGRVALFSRSRDEITVSFPEIAEAFGQLDRPVILDGEILAWDPAANRALPFSSLQQRVGRKRITAEMRERTPVVFMAFDLLYLDGELMLERPLAERRAALEAFESTTMRPLTSKEPIDGYSTLKVTPVTAPGGYAVAQRPLFEEAPDLQNVADTSSQEPFSRLAIAPAIRLESAEQLDRAYDQARARGNEGVMLKALLSPYQPGRRGLAWLKLKRELATLDVVVTAVEYGHGRRANVLSDYTFAVRDGFDLRNVGKAYSGLTDAEINENTGFFLDHTIENYGRVRSVEPLLVLEVAFNNVMRSERHASGFALRFPRILRIRTDKLPADIDTLARVEEIYASQPDKPVESVR